MTEPRTVAAPADDIESLRRERDQARADAARLASGKSLNYLSDLCGEAFALRVRSYGPPPEPQPKWRGGRVRCEECSGVGVIWDGYTGGGPPDSSEQVICPTCRGRGSLNADGSRW